jgi:carbon-monoxide dehydrogenase medium subunit
MVFQFEQPENMQEALALLAEYGDEAKIIAGGSALVLMLQQKLLDPKILISLKKVAELVYERDDGEGLQLGAMVGLSHLAKSTRIKGEYQGLALACGEVGNVRVRNQATLGGNLAEADYASDPPAMLLALDASVTAAGPNGRRDIPISEFFLGFYTTALEADEILTGVSIPPLATGGRSTYLKFRSRSSEDRPLVGVAAAAAFDGPVCRELRLAVGAACETPQRIAALEELARGQSLSEELTAEIAEGYAKSMETLEDLRGSAWYRKQMIRVNVSRALRQISTPPVEKGSEVHDGNW